MSELLSAALEYADRGLKVFPIWPDTKQPLTANGHLNATTNDDQITQWWTAYPAANVGLSLADSGLVALDIDAYKTECAWEHYRGANIVDAGFIQKAPAAVCIISSQLIPRIPSLVAPAPVSISNTEGIYCLLHQLLKARPMRCYATMIS